MYSYAALIDPKRRGRLKFDRFRLIKPKQRESVNGFLSGGAGVIAMMDAYQKARDEAKRK